MLLLEFDMYKYCLLKHRELLLKANQMIDFEVDFENKSLSKHLNAFVENKFLFVIVDNKEKHQLSH